MCSRGSWVGGRSELRALLDCPRIRGRLTLTAPFQAPQGIVCQESFPHVLGVSSEHLLGLPCRYNPDRLPRGECCLKLLDRRIHEPLE